MQHLRWIEKPIVHDAIFLAAFTGWNDAGDAASEAVKYLTRRFEGKLIASIDPEYFYDFASLRPNVRLEGDERHIDWPANEVRIAELDDGRSLITLVGIEPRLRWQTYAKTLTTIASELNVKTAITLGAFLTDTHHQAPIEVIGASSNKIVNRDEGLEQSSYEGPTGIVGVLNESFHSKGFTSLSFWAKVPSYIGHSPSPKAALALAKRTADFLSITLGATDLQIAASNYEQQLDALVASDPNLSQYADQILEHEAGQAADEIGEMADNPQEMIDELEQFLRQQDEQ